MKKVLLIDDEERILQGLCHIVDWEACGFTVAGAFSDSQEAAQAALAMKPELIITDIEMPELSGLQLISSLRGALPATRFVILSAHDQFNYAQQAVRLGAFRYILKPIDKNELTEVLREVAAEASDREEPGEENGGQSRHRSYLKSLIVREAISDGVLRAEEERDALCRELYGGFSYRLLLLCPQLPLDESLEYPCDPGPALGRMARLLAERLPGAVLFRHEDLLALVEELPGGGELPEALAAQLGERLGFPVAVGVTGGHTGLMQAHVRLLDAVSDFQRRLFFDLRAAPCLMPEETAEGGPDIPKRLPEELRRRLLSLLFQADLQGLGEFFDEALVWISERGRRGTPAQVHGFYQSMINTAFTDCLKFHEEKGTPPALPRLRKLADYHIYAKTLMTRVLNQSGEPLSDGGAHLVSRVKLHIMENYGDPELKLRQLADAYYVNYSYLSHLFVKKSGVTFSSYLTEVRVENAKKLLEHSQLSVSEVAKKVGFQDSQSFFYAFRRLCGVSPKAYRQNAGGRVPGDS